MTNDDLTTSKKTTFLNDETFALLKEAQQRLQDDTGFSPSLKVLINDVVTPEAVNQSIKRLVTKLTSLNT